MTILVVGANGATGCLLVKQLLDRGQEVRAIARSPGTLPDLAGTGRLSLIHASLPDQSDRALAQCVEGCSAVVSCLGHNLSLKGMYGRPRRLVTDATRRLCNAIKAAPGATPVRYLLMNTAGNRNLGLDEPISPAQRGVIGLLRLLLPPHVDNEQAAEYLRTRVGTTDPAIEWVVVRPDSLIDADAVTPYEAHASPIRSALFDAGKTSRINVAHFMADLATDDVAWRRWKHQMPVIYNQD